MNALEKKIKTVADIFNINQVTNESIFIDDIKRYYKINFLPYLLFYSQNGFLHMGITPKDRKYSEKDLQKQVEIINEHINTNTKSVLELACGRGVNTKHLAKLHPNVSFIAIDYSSIQVKSSILNNKSLKNVHIVQGDFHELEDIKSESMDICFNIEALCYSTNKSAFFKEMYRILKPKGKLIIFDGYSTSNRFHNKLNDTTMKLVEYGMAVPIFEEYQIVKKYASDCKFQLENEVDFSNEIIPSMQRMESLGKYFFFSKYLGRLINSILPLSFTKNAITGYLMPSVIQENLACYMYTVFKK